MSETPSPIKGAQLERARKVIIVGSTIQSFENENVRVTCIPWSRLSSAPDLRDFDLVVISYLGQIPNAVYSAEIARVFTQDVPIGVMGAGGDIVVLGDARGAFPLVRGLAQPQVLYLNWTGWTFDWDAGAGDTITVSSDEIARPFLPYLRRVKRWNYTMRSAVIDQVASARWNAAVVAPLQTPSRTFALQPEAYALARTRFGQTLASTHRIVVRENLAFPPNTWQTQWTSGWLTLLPSDGQPEDEAIITLLREAFGIWVHMPEPAWIRDLVVPNQAPLDCEISELRARQNELETRLTESIRERERVREVLSVLYETGPELETAVRSLLERMGATVEASAERNKADGWVTVHVGSTPKEGVLEIKGTRKSQFAESGIRQLAEWVQLGIEQRGIVGKGIFIGVHAAETAPSQRETPYSPSFLRSLELNKFVAVTTAQLLRAYERIATGNLTRDKFWARLFATNGAFKDEDLG